MAALDATGLDTRYASTHYRYTYSARYVTAYQALHAGRRPARPHYRPGHPKLTAVVHTATHLIVGAVPAVGPAHDTPDAAPAVRQAHALLAFLALVADAGYDAEALHRCCREELGVGQTAIALNRRMHDPRRPPQTPYRRAMYDAFPAALYRERTQAESTFAQHKRRLGAALHARSAAAQAREQVLRVLTHNLLLLHCGLEPLFNRADDRESSLPRDDTSGWPHAPPCSWLPAPGF